MTWIDSFTQAAVIMCLGMGLVFLFVASLVILIQISARMLAGYAEEEQPATPPVPASSSADEGAVVAAIVAALQTKTTK